MKSIEERMAVLLNPEMEEAVLTEQVLFEAVRAADEILEANGLELSAGDLNSYIEGLRDVLEHYELSEEDHAELQELFTKMVRFAGNVAGGIGKAVGTVKKAKAAVGSAIQHVKKSYAKGHVDGETHDPKGGVATDWAEPEKQPETEGPKKPNLWQRAVGKYQAWRAKPKPPSDIEKYKEAERAKRATPGGQHAAKGAAALAAKQDAAKQDAAKAAAEKTAPAASEPQTPAAPEKKKKRAVVDAPPSGS
jgi:hypothetical protein